MIRYARLALIAAALGAVPAAAQSGYGQSQSGYGQSRSGGGLGALSGLIGQGGSASGLSGLGAGLVPGVGATSMGNVAGLLGYCLQNNLLGGATGTGSPNTAQAVLGQLTGQRNATTSPGYAAGQEGQVQAGGRTLSLDSLKGQVKNRVCGAILQHAKSFLPK